MNHLQAEGRCSFTVQFDEVDSYRIVHHSRLVAYLERGRLPLLVSLGFDPADSGLAAVVYSMKLDFKKPARLLEELQVTSRVESVESCKIVLAERVMRGKDLILKARTELVFLDPADQLPLPVPEVFR